MNSVETNGLIVIIPISNTNWTYCGPGIILRTIYIYILINLILTITLWEICFHFIDEGSESQGIKSLTPESIFLTTFLAWHSPKADLKTSIQVQVIYLEHDFSEHGKKWGIEGKKVDQELLISRLLLWATGSPWWWGCCASCIQPIMEGYSCFVNSLASSCMCGPFPHS